MKKNNKLKLLVVLALVLTLTGCTKELKDENKKTVTNPETGQNLTANILCKPEDEATYNIYKENKVDVDSLPSCSEFKPNLDSDGFWENFFVKPLAFLILTISKYAGHVALGLILASLLIRLIAYPLTNKAAVQSELIKKAQPELERIEKKYANRQDQDSLLKKSQEMTLVYKKYNINPLSGCLFSFIQLPLFFSFFEAINRVPALFEGTFLSLQLGTTPLVGLQHGNFAYLVLVIATGASTYLSFKLNKTSHTSENDPMKSMGTTMTIMITVMSLFMTSALGVYWITSNLFTIVQNLIVKRSCEVNE